jgi:hypothetical protein
MTRSGTAAQADWSCVLAHSMQPYLLAGIYEACNNKNDTCTNAVQSGTPK